MNCFRLAAATTGVAALLGLAPACGGATKGNETGDLGVGGSGATDSAGRTGATGGEGGQGAIGDAPGDGDAGDNAPGDGDAGGDEPLLDDLCREGRDDLYRAIIDELGEQIERCTRDDECGVIARDTRCGIPCDLPINLQYAEAAEVVATAYAEDNCSTCPDVSCPDQANSPVCMGGYCAYLLVP